MVSFDCFVGKYDDIPFYIFNHLWQIKQVGCFGLCKYTYVASCVSPEAQIDKYLSAFKFSQLKRYYPYVDVLEQKYTRIVYIFPFLGRYTKKIKKKKNVV